MTDPAPDKHRDPLLRFCASAELLVALAAVTVASMAVVAFAEGRREVAAPMAALALPLLVALALLELTYRARRHPLQAGHDQT